MPSLVKRLAVADAVQYTGRLNVLLYDTVDTEDLFWH
jgi:hypothetical protein